MLTIDKAELATKSPGVYSFPQAARILSRAQDVNTKTLRSWWRSGLVHRSNESGELLTFHDLISLEIVGRFRAQGVSLQRVRQLEEGLIDREPLVARPFALRVFFTDGASIWVDFNGATEEVIGKAKGQHVFREAISTFATEIRYHNDVAVAWDVAEMVEVDPLVNFGAPVVRGTRVKADTVLKNLKVATKEEVADMYGLSIVQVDGVIEFSKAA